MIIDKSLQISSEQALTATDVSTDIIDLGHNQLVGPGDPLWWVIAVRAGLVGSLFFARVQSAADEAFGSPVTHNLGQAYDTLPTGSRIVIPMTWQNERFLRLQYEVTGTITIDAWLTNQEPAKWSAFPNAI